jgi:hypothetical protein
MPTFDFQSPDGRKFTLTGPEGATPEQAFAVLQQHLANNQRADPKQSRDDWDQFPLVKSGPEAWGAIPVEKSDPRSWGTVPAGSDAPSMPEGVVRAGATGVPIIGGLANKLDAVVDRFLPDSFETLPEATFGERYKRALEIQSQKDAAFSHEHPVASTAAELAGGAGTLMSDVAAIRTCQRRHLTKSGSPQSRRRLPIPAI